MPVVFLVVAVALLVSLCVFATTESLVLAAVAYLSVGMFVSGLVMSLVVAGTSSRGTSGCAAGEFGVLVTEVVCRMF